MPEVDQALIHIVAAGGIELPAPLAPWVAATRPASAGQDLAYDRGFAARRSPADRPEPFAPAAKPTGKGRHAR